MTSNSEERQLGDYRLKEILSETAVLTTWLAEQVSISRAVLVDELKEGQEDRMPEFLADIRAKAAVDHPLIGSVYEASAEPGKCFYAYELLPGLTFAQKLQAGEGFPPARLSNILRRIAEAQLLLESSGSAAEPLDLNSIHIDNHGVIRLTNLIVAGGRDPNQSSRDILRLGTSLTAMVANGQPGVTRMLTLLKWMRGEELEVPLEWGQVRDVCMQIEHQLADPLSIVPGSHNAPKKKQPLGLIAGLTAFVLLAIVFAAFKLRPPVPASPPRVALPEPVLIAAGTYAMPDGSEETVASFRISANETTIGQYAEFLAALDLLSKDNRATLFDHPDQPPEKKSHKPDDWDALLEAAKTGGTWKNHPVDLSTPVVGVDWWDAAAYAGWKKGRLPTQEEWHASLASDVKNPAAVPPSSWVPVTTQGTDRTPAGVIGLAGSVSEWTAKPAPNPANPLGEKLWVIAGGSYLKAGSSATTREWTANRLLRRADLGFRVVFDEK